MTKEDLVLVLRLQAASFIAFSDVETVRDAFREVAECSDEQWNAAGDLVVAVRAVTEPAEPTGTGLAEDNET